MHTIAVVSIMFAALLLCTNGADAAPWRAEYGFGGTNCGFYSFEQCQAARSGNGGFCSQNSFENPYSTGEHSRRRYRRNFRKSCFRASPGINVAFLDLVSEGDVSLQALAELNQRQLSLG